MIFCTKINDVFDYFISIKYLSGCLFFAMSIVKIRLQKVRLNFHRRNGPRCFEREYAGVPECWSANILSEMTQLTIIDIK